VISFESSRTNLPKYSNQEELQSLWCSLVQRLKLPLKVQRLWKSVIVLSVTDDYLGKTFLLLLPSNLVPQNGNGSTKSDKSVNCDYQTSIKRQFLDLCCSISCSRRYFRCFISMYLQTVILCQLLMNQN